MHVALILFDGLTMLDFIGFYDPLTRLKSMGYLPKLQWSTCATSDEVADTHGLKIKVSTVLPDLADFDLIFLPGGLGTRDLLENQDFILWLKSAEKVPLKTSVCTGSLLLGAAGFLEDKRATTHFDHYDQLKPFCKTVVERDIVDDNNVITAGAVSTSLDLGLYLCEKIAGADAKNVISKRIAYSGKV
ncbi:MAG: DJ-1/PfpI family protein [Saprospiraceae bacterium]|nr:DJ-1/PfpI family protein [Saprospiraceae bacterium]